MEIIRIDHVDYPLLSLCEAGERLTVVLAGGTDELAAIYAAMAEESEVRHIGEDGCTAAIWRCRRLKSIAVSAGAEPRVTVHLGVTPMTQGEAERLGEQIAAMRSRMDETDGALAELGGMASEREAESGDTLAALAELGALAAQLADSVDALIARVDAITGGDAPAVDTTSGEEDA